MLTPECLAELQSAWLPNVTDAGLDRLVELLEKDSPLLVQGCFTKAIPMGCLATYAAWHHPETSHLIGEAGIQWLSRVAGLNPATSRMIRAWDVPGPHHRLVRAELLAILRRERQARRSHEPALAVSVGGSAHPE